MSFIKKTISFKCPNFFNAGVHIGVLKKCLQQNTKVQSFEIDLFCILLGTQARNLNMFRLKYENCEHRLCILIKTTFSTEYIIYLC